VYRSPRSRSVATFLGETNLLEGRIIARRGALLEVEAGTLKLLAEARAGFEPGQAALLSIRPEAIHLAGSPQGEDSFPVEAERSSYLGELCEHEISHQGVKLRAYELNPHLPDRHGSGSALWAQVRPADVVLLEPEHRA
jgi:ABC-type Fe3+/spermidine/putrescine transport system ATPase subunit